jgi:hypothetical protein
MLDNPLPELHRMAHQLNLRKNKNKLQKQLDTSYWSLEAHAKHERPRSELKNFLNAWPHSFKVLLCLVHSLLNEYLLI